MSVAENNCFSDENTLMKILMGAKSEKLITSYSTETNTTSQWKKTVLLFVFCFTFYAAWRNTAVVYFNLLKCNMVGFIQETGLKTSLMSVSGNPHCGSPCIDHKAFLASSQALCSFSSLLPLVYPIIYLFSGPP